MIWMKFYTGIAYIVYKITYKFQANTWNRQYKITLLKKT